MQSNAHTHTIEYKNRKKKNKNKIVNKEQIDENLMNRMK